MGRRWRGGSTPTLAPTARNPGFWPAAFAGKCFYDFYLAVDEGAEGGAAGADHADCEFELTVVMEYSVRDVDFGCWEEEVLTSRLLCSRECRWCRCCLRLCAASRRGLLDGLYSLRTVMSPERREKWGGIFGRFLGRGSRRLAWAWVESTMCWCCSWLCRRCIVLIGWCTCALI